MSKKMSIQDMKEVKRLVSILITNEFKETKFIESRCYRGNAISFVSNISSTYLNEYIEEIVDNHKITKELADIQIKLFEKQKELIKVLTNANKKDIKDTLENDGNANPYSRSYKPNTELFDEFNVINKASSSIQDIIFERLEEIVKTFVSKLNTYINETEARVFDAYTKGMTADDFLNIVREELREFHNERDNIIKELEENGYKPK